jgi:hypothetical protein
MIELAKEKKEKAKLLPSSGFDIAVPDETEDDPRIGMSKEEMLFYEKQEQNDLEKRMDRFMQGKVAQPSTEGISDEEEEIFTLNLEKGRIEQKIVDVEIPVETFREKINEIVTKEVIKAHSNPITDLITNIYTKKALVDLIAKLRVSRQSLDVGLSTGVTSVTSSQVDGITKLINDLDDQIHSLRISFSAYSQDVYVDKIPGWAWVHIRRYVQDSLEKLIEFVGE